LIIEALAAPALPAFGLRERDQMGLRVRLPEAAVSRQVFEEGADAVLALAHRVLAEHDDGLRAPGLDGALQPLAMDGKVWLAVVRSSRRVVQVHAGMIAGGQPGRQADLTYDCRQPAVTSVVESKRRSMMSNDGLSFGGVTLIVKDMAASLGFYRKLGLSIPAESVWPAEGIQHHVGVDLPGGGRLELDSVAMTRSFDSGWQEAGPSSRNVLSFSLPSREAVDEKLRELTSAGYRPHLAPIDGFWGARYAIVEDPDGNHLGLMSPMDAAHGSAPPKL
jgi:catechol 2,3-dioxygenase-like lactoylglutathione lyase family enzyme